ncbi:exo-alpha-sialidase [Plantactinospora sp. CA-294935]|uniref:exo-alpha-sialidase n=1 Tax=Plantactinospora sp. CA-294935 TaxID=3240012 RepID=UPI003D94CA1D
MIRPVVVTLMAATGVMAAGSAGSAVTAVEPVGTDKVLFSRGEAGYFCYRIPTLVKATNGDLLAIVEGRERSCNDDADIDLVLKRSTDGGVTWGSVQLIAEAGGDTLGNPVPVVDERTGRIVILANRNAYGACPPCDRDVYQLTSDDHGATWTAPRELPHLKRPEWDRFIANGPVHGIQLKRGPHAGRLVVSSGHEMSNGDQLPVFGAHLYYSDDGGDTWQIGATIADFEGRAKPTETTVVELTDGRLYVSAREVASASDGVRAYAYSSDGGESFDGYFRMLPTFSTVQVQASLLRLTATDEGDARNRIMISTVAHPGAREVMAIRSSFDEARTWQTSDQGKVFWWGPTAYSDMVEIGTDATHGTMAGLLYEAGAANPYETIRWARFNEEYLETPNGTPAGFPPPPAPGPTTPDSSPRYDNTAYVRGDATLTGGRYGKGLALDKVDDGVEVPYTPAVDVEGGDFTAMTWFRYDATTGSHSILWAYRMNSAPQIWLRAEPASDRIRAFLGTGLGTAVTLASPTAYNDGAWHHIALQRLDRQLTMYVDGVPVATGTTPPGSVTNGREFGVHGLHVGQRLDGAERFLGTLDEFRLYGRALTADELCEIRTRNVPIAGQLRLRLPFETIDPR